MPDDRLVLFDFGGVVLRTPFELLPDEVAWRGPFGPPGHDDLWDRSVDDADELHERDYWHLRAGEVHPDVEDPTFALMRDLYEVDEALLIRPELLDLLDRLAADGFRLAVLTNDMRKFHGEDWVARMTVLDRFEQVIDLSSIGFLKPDGRAFEHALELLELPADGILFVDDQPPNVAGAVAAGMDAVHFDPTDVDASVARILGVLDIDESVPSSVTR